MAKWWKDKAPGNAKEVRDRLLTGEYKLRACPDCSRMNGRLSRDADDRCTFGHGCRRYNEAGQ